MARNGADFRFPEVGIFIEATRCFMPQVVHAQVLNLDLFLGSPVSRFDSFIVAVEDELAGFGLSFQNALSTQTQRHDSLCSGFGDGCRQEQIGAVWGVMQMLPLQGQHLASTQAGFNRKTHDRPEPLALAQSCFDFGLDFF